MIPEGGVDRHRTTQDGARRVAAAVSKTSRCNGRNLCIDARHSSSEYSIRVSDALAIATLKNRRSSMVAYSWPKDWGAVRPGCEAVLGSPGSLLL